MRYATLTRFSLLLVVVMISISSCKKSGTVPKSLLGTWNEPAFPSGFSRSVSFYSDGKFAAVFTAYPNPLSGGSSSTITTSYTGTFTVKGDSLLSNITTMAEQENTNTPVTSPSNQKLYEYATFKVSGNTLMLKYTTYPADAPVATEAKFTRFLPD
ncbi:hypothetical protein [Mucilaginibacter gilvus]|uniref:Lipocalin-like domain-containing protein n=1 Tax=Mucilaginibacter gilvus TaxID=2305909 RepID=A0A444MLY3_9SPHI|nr:hypothetical protein [Mucilaginibacter gilvus]RWY50290.1 hypothetical protein EPL05_16210 [Mucilaginibacter gilvus]